MTLKKIDIGEITKAVKNCTTPKKQIDQYKKAIDEEDFFTIEKIQKAYWKNFEDINRERNKKSE